MLGSCLRILWQYEWKEWRQLVNSLLELLSRNSHCTVPGSCYLETYIHLQHIPKPTSTKQLWGQPVLELTHPTIIPFYRRKVICPQEPTVYLTSSYKTALLPQGCMNVQIYKHHCSISCLGLWEVACLGLITRGGLNPDRFQLSAKKKWLTSDKYLQALFCAKTGKALWTWEVWLFKCLDFLELHNETVKRLQCKWSWERPHPLFFHSTLADRKMLLGKKFLFNRAHLVIKKNETYQRFWIRRAVKKWIMNAETVRCIWARSANSSDSHDISTFTNSSLHLRKLTMHSGRWVKYVLGLLQFSWQRKTICLSLLKAVLLACKIKATFGLENDFCPEQTFLVRTWCQAGTLPWSCSIMCRSMN